MLHECGRSYLQACLLLLIAEHPDHGYELGTRLAAFGLGDAGGAATYRALRTLERDGSIRSSWQPSSAGPDRRVYRLTATGQTALASCAAELQRNQVQLTGYLRRLHAIFDAARTAELSEGVMR